MTLFDGKEELKKAVDKDVVKKRYAFFIYMITEASKKEAICLKDKANIHIIGTYIVNQL